MLKKKDKEEDENIKEKIQDLSRELSALKPSISVDKLRSETLEEDLDKKIKQLQKLRVWQTKYTLKEEVNQFYKPPKTTTNRNRINIDFQTQTPQNISFSKFASESMEQRGQTTENDKSRFKSKSK